MSDSADRWRWGILGTGHIARAFARGLQDSLTARVLAVASREPQRADAFGDEFAVPNRHGSYAALLDDDQVQVVYVAMNHPDHAEWAIRTAAAGKHVLCEKPAAMNARDAVAMIDAARKHDVFFMEAFMYRCHAQTARWVELIRQGAIGEERAIQATFSYAAMPDARGRIPERAAIGGGVLDVGCYPVSLARLVAGLAVDAPFAEPISVQACGHIGASSRVDEWAAANLKFSSGIVAQLACGIRVMQDNSARIYGTKGWIHLPRPWQPAKNGGEWWFTLHRAGAADPDVIRDEEPRNIYAVEADYVAAHLTQRQATPPGMTWEDTLGNMRVLEMWREQLGLARTG